MLPRYKYVLQYLVVKHLLFREMMFHTHTKELAS